MVRTFSTSFRPSPALHLGTLHLGPPPRLRGWNAPSTLLEAPAPSASRGAPGAQAAPFASPSAASAAWRRPVVASGARLRPPHTRRAFFRCSTRRLAPRRQRLAPALSGRGGRRRHLPHHQEGLLGVHREQPRRLYLDARHARCRVATRERASVEGESADAPRASLGYRPGPGLAQPLKRQPRGGAPGLAASLYWIAGQQLMFSVGVARAGRATTEGTVPRTTVRSVRG